MKKRIHWHMISSNNRNVINNNHMAGNMVMVIVIAMKIRECLSYQELPDTDKSTI